MFGFDILEVAIVLAFLYFILSLILTSARELIEGWLQTRALHTTQGWTLTINSAYRCQTDNAKHQRLSTNHHGKAIDVDIVPAAAAGTDRQRCNTLRGLLVEKANAQIGWSALNRKSLEPAEIAPTWVHFDVRSYDPKYLDDKYFVTNAQMLDAAP